MSSRLRAGRIRYRASSYPDVLNNIAAQQVPLSAQFNNDGYAVLFKPGTYGSAATPLVFEVGYYTEVAGLGAVPQDTTINGQIEVFPNALDCASSTNCWANSTVNFWRSMSNLTLNVMDSANNYVPQPITQLPPIGDSADCYGGATDMWSVSQATPVRSMIINGTLNFQAYCSQTGYGSNDYGSGSYVANSEINGQLDWSGNQQGIARNSDFDSAAGYVWNYVYSGDGCPPGYTPPSRRHRMLAHPGRFQRHLGNNGTDGIIGVTRSRSCRKAPSPRRSRSCTRLDRDVGVFVPAVQHNSTGPNFLSGSEAGPPLPCRASSSPTRARRRARSRRPRRGGTWSSRRASTTSTPRSSLPSRSVVLGLGFPVLVPQRGNASMVVLPNIGVKLSGMIFDAGPVNSPVLLSVGAPARQGNKAGRASKINRTKNLAPPIPTSSRTSSSVSAEPRPRPYRPRSACSTTRTTRSSTTSGPGAPTMAPTRPSPVLKVK